MRLKHFHWVTAFLMLAGIMSASAATGVELRLFNAAVKMYNDKLYINAERNFADFVAKYPESDKRLEALLFESKARFYQSNVTGSVEILRDHLAEAGPLGDQFEYWFAQGLFELEQFETAAEHFGRISTGYQSSPLRLEAIYNRALSFARAGLWTKIVEELGTGGAFKELRQKQADNEFIQRAGLVLAEAYVHDRRFPEARAALAELNGSSGEAKWKKEFLNTRMLVDLGQYSPALTAVTNLFLAATNNQQFTAQTWNLEGEIFERLNQHAFAIQAYEKNLAAGLPLEIRRRALLKTIELTIAQENRTSEAVRRLELFIENNAGDRASDVALLTLGELQLQQYHQGLGTNTARNTNALVRTWVLPALTNFDRLISNFTQSPFLGKAHLNRGWCMWILGDWAQSKAAFDQAVKLLPVSEDQAVAHFKTGDIYFRTNNFADAVREYNYVLRNYENIPAIRDGLFDQALYQIVRASLGFGDYATAEQAVKQILTLYPNNSFSERAALLVGENLNHRGKAPEARQLLQQFASQATNATILPQVKLAIARTYLQEGDWRSAISEYEKWLGRFAGHGLGPQAEFGRALAYYQSGQETNAIPLLTNFVARFPSNQLAVLAQNCIADYYFNHDEFAEAERNYQLLYQSFRAPIELSGEARLMAGRSAFARQGLTEARKYFSELLSDTNTPASIAAEAYFALGDTAFEQFLVSTNKPKEDFDDAINAFVKITKDYSTNSLAARAWGRIGDCYTQWAVLRSDTNSLAVALNAYSNVLASPVGDPASRFQAEIGLGRICEMRGQSLEAVSHYSRVFHGADGEEYDPFWVNEAGLAAARVCETLNEWEQALAIYRRLLNRFPSMRPVLDKRIDTARQRFEAARK